MASRLGRPVVKQEKKPKRWVIILGAVGVVVAGVFGAKWAVNKLSK